MSDDSHPSIAICLPSLIGGGAETSMLRLAEGLAAAGYRVTFVLNKATGALLTEAAAQFEIVDLDASRTLTALPKLRAWIKNKQPDILLSALTYNNLLAALVLQSLCVKTRHIAVEHSLPSRYLHMHNPAVRLLVRLALRFIYKRAERIVAVSALAAADLQRLTHAGPGKITIISNPVIADDFQTQTHAPADHPWLRDKTTPVVLGVGRMVPVKNFALLVEAFAKLRQRSDARLIILGDGPQRAALQTLVAQHELQDTVSMPGFTSQIFSYLRESDLLAVSSQWESFGNVVAESLACGTPVVSTDCGGPAEILDGGAYGRLVPQGDAQAFADAMLAALSMPADKEKLQTRGMHYTVSRAVASYRHLFENQS